MIQNQIYRAVAWMLGGMLSLFSIGLLGKYLGSNFNSFEIMFYRSIIAFPFLCLLIALTGNFNNFRIHHLPLHLFRNIVHFTAQNLWFYALAILPLAVVITFEFTTPGWVIIIAAIALKEGFGWRRAFVIALSLIGVLLITDPRQIEFGWPIMAALLCAIGFASTTILTKKLTRFQNVYEIIFMMALLQGIFATIVIIAKRELTLPDLDNLPALLAIAFFGTSSHFCITKALSLADASIVAPVDLIRLPLSVLAGYFLFDESITWAMFLGGLFLLYANYFNIKRKTTSQ